MTERLPIRGESKVHPVEENDIAVGPTVRRMSEGAILLNLWALNRFAGEVDGPNGWLSKNVEGLSTYTD